MDDLGLTDDSSDGGPPPELLQHGEEISDNVSGEPCVDDDEMNTSATNSLWRAWQRQSLRLLGFLNGK